jgi:predicted permease
MNDNHENINFNPDNKVENIKTLGTETLTIHVPSNYGLTQFLFFLFFMFLILNIFLSSEFSIQESICVSLIGAFVYQFLSNSLISTIFVSNHLDNNVFISDGYNYVHKKKDDIFINTFSNQTHKYDSINDNLEMSLPFRFLKNTYFFPDGEIVLK